jgi:large subunit ribosomal protein L19
MMEQPEGIEPFNPGDTVRVSYRIREGGKTRVQPYEGVVLGRRGRGVSQTLTVRRVSVDGIGVERIFPLFSPNLTKLEVLKKGRVRRAKLYYLRRQASVKTP